MKKRKPIPTKRLVKAIMYLHGLIEAMDSNEIPKVDEDLELILKGRKCSVEQDMKTFKEVCEELGVSI